MREILFRGKRIDNGEWVEGLPFGSIYGGFSNGAICAIRQTVEKYGDIHDVVIETVGQFTGLTDKNGKRIFEGDVMVFCQGATRPFEIRWDGLGWKMFCADGTRIKDSFESWEIWYMQKSEVIGNIYDNPELLEVKE